jgi:hypothetical protein
LDLGEVIGVDKSDGAEPSPVATQLQDASAVIYLYDHSPQGFAIIHEAFEKHEVDQLHANAETCLLVGTSPVAPSEDDRLWLHARSLAVDHCCELVHHKQPSQPTYTSADPAFDSSLPTDAEGGADELETAGLSRVWEALSCCPWPHTAAGDPDAKPPVFRSCAGDAETESKSNSVESDDASTSASTAASAKDADITDLSQLASLAALALNADTTSTSTNTTAALEDDDERAFASMEELMSRAGAVRARAMAGQGTVASRRQDAEAVALALAKAMGLFDGEEDDDDMDINDLIGGI